MASVPNLNRRGRAEDALVLCYHCFSTRWTNGLSVLPERLEEQVELLLARGYRGVTFQEAVLGRTRGPVVAVTFDDAFHSVLEFAVPILRRLGLPGTIFAPTAYVSAGGPATWPTLDAFLGTEDEPELAMLTWGELRGLADEGWEVASHTRTHADLPLIGDDELALELLDSRRACEEELGRPCRSMAYPYGHLDARVVRAVGAAGYRAAAALKPFPRLRPLSWPRVEVTHRDTLATFEEKISPSRRRRDRIQAGLLFKQRRRAHLAIARRVALAQQLARGAVDR